MPDVLSTHQLIGVVEQTPKFTPLFLQMFFPTVITFDSEEIKFDKIKKSIKLAPFVAPMIAGKPNKAKGGYLASFVPAYLKPTDVVTANRTLKRLPGEPLGGDMTPAQRRNAIRVDILDEQDKSITHREEWMAVQAVIRGAVLVEGAGYETQLVDFGRSPENNISLMGAAKWDMVDPETYDPTDDIEEWAEKSSSVVSVLVFSKDTWRMFSSFKKVKEKLDTTMRGFGSELELGPQLAKEVRIKGHFGDYLCMVYAGKYEDENDTSHTFMPSRHLLLAPSVYDGVRAYGAIQDAEANDDGIVETSRYPSNWFTKNPSVEFLQTQSAPLMVTPDPDAFIVVQV